MEIEVANPLYYIEMYGSWRSMRPPVWKEYAEAMMAHLRHQMPKPIFEDYGKSVYGRPSRVKVTDGPGDRRVYWTTESHLMVRSPKGWEFRDWQYEASYAAQFCKIEEVSEGPDIFHLVMQG